VGLNRSTILLPTLSPVFERPPINELGLGIKLVRPAGLKIAHLGQFWSAVRSDFPLAEENAPIGPIEAAPNVGGLPLPRLWFLSQDRVLLLQLQLDRFHLNWRSLSKEQTYPSFKSLLPVFLGYLDLYNRYVKEMTGESIVISEVELLKSSHMLSGEAWTDLRSIGGTVSFISCPPMTGLVACSNVAASIELTFDECLLRADMKHGKLKADPKREVLILELRARPTGIEGTTLDLSKMDAVLRQANSRVNYVFTSVVAVEVQQNVWGRKS
jgi:hypothetical protein